jgi:hypothetical protein
MDVIETPQQLNEFLEHYRTCDEVFLDATRANQTVHPRRSGVSFVLVRAEEREALLPIRHNDATGLNPKYLLKLNTDARKYVLGKKRILHLVPFRGLVDCRLLRWFIKNRPPSEPLDRIRPTGGLNIYRPLMRLAERSQRRLDLCERIAGSFGEVVEKRPFRKYNEEVLETLFRVERSGMFARGEEFKKIFGKDLTDKQNLAYSKYNLYTQTGRPSNAHRGVNYAALDPEQREVFSSRFENGSLLNIDYDAFHLRLISSLTGYDAPEGSFHKHLGKLYFGKEQLTDKEYSEAKKFTFQFLYNPKGIPEELLQLEFFDGVRTLTERIWDRYQKHGVIQTAKHGRQITGSEIENFNPAKALNYTLQSTGVEILCSHMKRLLDYLSGKESKVILYLYDSVLVDLHPSDAKELPKFRNIMETEKLKVDFEAGSRFGSLEPINIDG